MLGFLHLVYEESQRSKTFVQGKENKNSSEDNGTNCDFSWTGGVFAGADETGDGSKNFMSTVACCRHICCAVSSMREKVS